MIGNQNTIKIGQAVISIIEECKEPLVVEWDALHCHDAAGKTAGLDEGAFARAYVAHNRCECHDDLLYFPEQGFRRAKDVILEIQKWLGDPIECQGFGYKKSLRTAAENIVSNVFANCNFEGRWEIPKTILPFRDGNLDISDPEHPVFRRGFLTVMPYRFPVAFPTGDSDCPRWKAFLHQLLRGEEDIESVQMFLGHCLIPSNDSQSLLWLYGSAGAGKSQIWKIIDAIWGGNGFYSTNFSKLEKDFALESYRYSLILGDDDVSENGIDHSEMLKKLISGQIVERNRKNEPHDQIRPFYHLIALSNFPPKTKDMSAGLQRRIYPIQVQTMVKPHQTGKSIGAEIVNAELPGIVRWVLEGMFKWLQNDRCIRWSEQTILNQRAIIEEADSLHQFAHQRLKRNPESRITTEDLLRAYVKYCDENELVPVAGFERTFGYLDCISTAKVSKFGSVIKPILYNLGGKPISKVPVRGSAERKSGWEGFEL